MKPRQLERGNYVYKMDTTSDEMYVIQSGIVEICHTQDNGEEFIIEKLYRGSVINHNSFLMNDDIDTDARCKSTVTLFYIDIAQIKKLRQRHMELETALIMVEMILVNPNAAEPALDYIIKDPYSEYHYLKHYKDGTLVHDYAKEQRRRMLTVKLKNAIMHVWLKVKKSRNKPNMEEIIKGLVAKQREQQSMSIQTIRDEKKKQRKERREKQRLE